MCILVIIQRALRQHGIRNRCVEKNQYMQCMSEFQQFVTAAISLLVTVRYNCLPELPHCSNTNTLPRFFHCVTG